MPLEVKKAEFRPKKLKFFLMGESDGGKTFTALKMGKLFHEVDGKRWCLIENEEGRWNDYYHDFECGEWLDVIELDSKEARVPEMYVQAINKVQLGDYGGLIIDGMSPFWEGVNDHVEAHAEALAQKYGKDNPNTFNAWAGKNGGNAVFQKVVSTIAAVKKMHVIMTVRLRDAYKVTKQSYGDSGRSRTVIVRDGKEPYYRKGSYRFQWTFVGIIEKGPDRKRHLQFEKCGSCKELDGRDFVDPGKEVVDAMRHWLGDN